MRMEIELEILKGFSFGTFALRVLLRYSVGNGMVFFPKTLHNMRFLVRKLNAYHQIVTIKISKNRNYFVS